MTIKEKKYLFFKKPIFNFYGTQKYIIVLIITAGIYFSFFYMPKQTEIKNLENEYSIIKTKLATYKQKAESFVKYKKIMDRTIIDFNSAVKNLPNKKEIPFLLTSISQSGNNAGIKFVLFEPRLEVKKEFYSEIPIAIKIQGEYHQIIDFFNQISSLKRIVNIKDLNISTKKNSEQLEISCTAVTYMLI